jgi:hypothetical protein
MKRGIHSYHFGAALVALALVLAPEGARVPAAEPGARHVTAQGVPDDFLFPGDFVWLGRDCSPRCDR